MDSEYSDPKHLDSSLCQKICESLLIMVKALESVESNKNLLLSYNGGKDSAVMFFLLQSLFDKSGTDPILNFLKENGFDTEVADINFHKEMLKVDN